MSRYTTIVIKMPENQKDAKQVAEALRLLDPFKTGMSLGDDMTVLDMIENHEDFEPHIADDARARTSELHDDLEKNPQ